jgi:hypothetical protein
MGWYGFLMFVCGFMSLVAADHVKACRINIYICNLLVSLWLLVDIKYNYPC